MAVANAIDAPTLRQLLRLDSHSGLLYWRERPREMFSSDRIWVSWNTRFSGAEALTCVIGRGRTSYRTGAILGVPAKAHRVVFALHHGRVPVLDIDHINGDGLDNRPSNLREATLRQNMQNRAGTSRTSAFKGVYWCKRDKRWIAGGRDRDGRQVVTGRFLDETEAALAYDAFAAQEHGPFARLNFP